MFHNPHLGNVSSLSHYVSNINAFPTLGKDEEYMLAKEWKEAGNAEAMDKIIKSHLKLVWKIARGYRGYGLPVEDLIAEGAIGVMQAVRNFDPERGFRFSTYAQWWIKASIQDYIMRSWSLVKISTQKTHKKLFFGLNRLKAALGFADKRILSPEEVRQVSEKMNVPTEQIIEMERRLSASDFSLNAPRSEEENGDEWQDWVEDTTENQETTTLHQQELDYRRNLLVCAIKHLTPREYKVLSMRRLAEEPLTLGEVAQRVNLSRERVRQIENAAFTKLQRTIRNLSQENPRTLVMCLIGVSLSDIWAVVDPS
ncbi:MAG: RNA polymerase factor sigma-32 [Holosporales bacterium]|jgi:RNA polymerase sigma-32 factor|nr:RNA polymerase factor sigma-32 [Holosporales bacterium]